MRSLFGVISTALMLGAAPGAFAQCVGTIQGVVIQPTSGDVLVERINLTTGEVVWWPRFCSIVSTANGIPPEGCKPVYAALLATQAQAKSITYYKNVGSCASSQPWQWMDGFYFLMVNN